MLILDTRVPSNTPFGNAYANAQRIANKFDIIVCFHFNGVAVQVGGEEHMHTVAERYERDYKHIIQNGQEGLGDIPWYQE